MLRRYLVRRFEEIESRNESRDVEADTSVFDRISLVFVVFILVGFASFTIYKSITPPKSVVNTINENPSRFLQYPNGSIFFSEALTPKQATSAVRFPISLPYRSAQTLKGYIKNGIWYEFRIYIPKNRFNLGETAILVPLVWGKSQVFLNGKLHSYGDNHWPLLGIEQPEVTIHIRANLDGTAFSNPILATFPIIAGPSKDLREIISTVNKQIATEQISQFPFLAALALMGAFYLAYRRRPELFVFIGFLGVSYIYANVSASNANNTLLFWNRDVQQIVLLLLDFVQNSILLVFSFLFFRFSFQETVRKTKFPLFSILIIGVTLTYTSNKLGVGTTALRQIGHIAISILFFATQAILFVPETWHLAFRSSAPKLRRYTAIFVIGAILLVYALNVSDYFGLLTMITTQYRNSFLIYMVLSMFVAFEAARSEGHKRILAKLISTEAKVGIEQDRTEVSGEGFVILVDAIGFTADRTAFMSQDEMRRYAVEIFQPIAKSVSRIRSNGISLLNSTGDGLYFVLKGPASKENFECAQLVANEIISSSATSSLKLRVAIGYGQYTVFLFRYGTFQKEVVFGNVLNDLSRIIGGQGVRLLIYEQTHSFKTAGAINQVTDKHGHKHSFCELRLFKKNAA